MTTIKLKNGSGAPTSGDLTQGEPALDLTNKRLYTEDSGGTVIEVGTNPGVDVTFADNRKAVFGAGSDLQIYHDGSNSYVQDAGDGALILNTTNGGGVYVYSAGETMATFNSNGAVNLYHDNAAKLATTATGIDVTGTVTADGLTVDKANGALLTLNATNAGTPSNLITFSDADGDTAFVGFISNSTDNLTVYNATATGDIELRTNALKRLNIDGATGDISFYEDTGTTAKFFWDASAESLGIGTSSPAYPLHIWSDTTIARFGGTDTNDTYLNIFKDNASSIIKVQASKAGTGATNVAINPDGGNVGIGTSSPQASIHTEGDVIIGTATSGASYEGVLQIADGAVNGRTAVLIYNNHPDQFMKLGQDVNTAFIGRDQADEFAIGVFDNASDTTLSKQFVIDASGNLLVGTTNVNPAANNVTGHAIKAGGLVEHANSGAMVMRLNRTDSSGSIIEFRQGTSAVGSIGTAGDDLLVGTGDTAFRFHDGDNRIYPVNVSDGVKVDGAVDLGDPTSRFKDLYLSGGVYLGGTGSANKLDDYEEGSWTPTLNSASFTASGVTSVSGAYVKIGDFVQVSFTISFSGTSGNFAEGDSASIGGLPFNPVTFNGGGTANASQDYLNNVRMTWQTLPANGSDDMVMIIHSGAGTVARSASVTGVAMYSV